jgi:O-succinylbenzoic acid--CoA ligase
MFISGGENIHPEVIEQVLESLPGIRRAVVLPLADAIFGQRPVAFILRADDAPEALWRAELVKRLPKFMIPIRLEQWPERGSKDGEKIPFAVFYQELMRLTGISVPPN